MPRIGVTGHTSLGADAAAIVHRLLVDAIAGYPAAEVHGITCLAPGADQLFARVVLDAGGTFEAIIPAADYRDRVVTAAQRPAFDELTARATAVSCMPFPHAGRPAYMAASEELLRRSDVLLAVWDGAPSRRLGDTADVVRAAHRRRLPVRVLWRAGLRRC
jgi:hypothetical protein